jgi:aspartate aminotransferase/aminotransferase
MVRLAEAQPKFISTYPDFKLTPKQLEAACTPRSKVLIFNSPVNPTGVAYSREEIAALASTAKRLKLKVISDEVYDLFCYDFPHDSWLKHDSDAILVRSFSKTWGMPGWRVGFVSGPAEVVDQMKVLQQFSFVCVPTPFQYACAEALKLSMEEYREKYARKRDIAFEGLKGAFKVSRPGGAFYIFPEYPGGDGERFLAKCMEQEVLVVPGNTFSQKNSHFRVSYALDNETLQRGVEKLVKIANS